MGGSDESRVELFARFRRDARVKGISIRCLGPGVPGFPTDGTAALAAAELPVHRVHGAGLQCRSHAQPGRTEGRGQAWRPTPANSLGRLNFREPARDGRRRPLAPRCCAERAQISPDHPPFRLQLNCIG